MITPQEAKEIMDNRKDYIVLDVRTQDEYQKGHIPNAILVPDYEIKEKASSALPNKNQTILVYCRSGRRSEAAAEELTAMGYTDVQDFGGIMSWPYDKVK